LTDQLASGSAQPNYAGLTADIVSAYVSKNSVRPADLPDLIGSVHTALRTAGTSAAKPEEAKPTPAVNPKKSITPDFLISLEDGRQYKSLKRHLSGRGLTPEQYRAKWGLPRDYPMVAESYAKKRSELAKKMQLGHKRGRPAQARTAATTERAAAAPAKKRGRKKGA
jgi:predicted transcriptional regulator